MFSIETPLVVSFERELWVSLGSRVGKPELEVSVALVVELLEARYEDVETVGETPLVVPTFVGTLARETVVLVR